MPRRKKSRKKRVYRRKAPILNLFSFPEFGISISAVDLKEAKRKLAEKLKGVNNK